MFPYRAYSCKAYNLRILRHSPALVLIALFLAALASPKCFSLQQESEAPRYSQILLIIPFENTTGTPSMDWIGEAFPEVLGNRLNTPSLTMISRGDRLRAYDRFGLPPAAKPSRATIYQIGKTLDADHVLLGSYRLEGSTLAVRARIMDLSRLRLSPELTESGPLTSLITIQTALAWDVLNSLQQLYIPSKQKFVEQFPPIRLDALENYIRGVLDTNNLEKIKHFKEAVRLDPNHTLAMLHLGRACYEVKDYECAMDWLAKIPKNDSNANEAQFYLGLTAFNADQMDKAKAAFNFLATRLPLAEVSNNLGVIAARQDDRRARAYFEKSVQTDPNDPDYHFNLAIELYREGHAQEAARELKDSLALQADAEAKTFQDAIGAGAQPTQLPPERIKLNYDESAFRQLALEAENTNEVRLGKMDPASHAAVHVQRGRELMNQGLAGEAEKQFREAVILDPTNAAAHAGLARVLESNQDRTAARNEARASLRLGPSAEAYLVLARLDLAENNNVAALENVDHALALDPANAVAVALKQDIAAAGLAGKAKPPQP